MLGTSAFSARSEFSVTTGHFGRVKWKRCAVTGTRRRSRWLGLAEYLWQDLFMVFCNRRSSSDSQC